MADKNGSEEPLPPGWTKGYSRSQKRTYYCHAESKHTQWHFPTASEVANPRMAKERAEQNAHREHEKKPASSSSSSSSSGGDKKRSGGEGEDTTSSTATSSSSSSSSSAKRQKLSPSNNPDLASIAIIVPYRDIHPSQNRSTHLRAFIPHMTSFLSNLVSQGLASDYQIYIIEQSNDGRKFNRGKLLNIGFDVAQSFPMKSEEEKERRGEHNVFIFHDVDLLPGEDLGKWYSKFPKTPIHIARCWDRYSDNPKYFGGIVSFSGSDMKRINGYPNTFWGWGGEDDEMQKRCEALGIRWDYPPRGTIRDLENMTLQEKLSFLRSNKAWKCMVKWEALEEHATTWKTNGLADLSYDVLKEVDLKDLGGKDGRSVKVTVDVKLNGDHWGNKKCGMDFMGDANWKKQKKKKWRR